MTICTVTLIDVNGKAEIVLEAEFDPGYLDVRSLPDGSTDGVLRAAHVSLPAQCVTSLRGFLPVHVKVEFEDGQVHLWEVATNFWNRSLARIPLKK